MYQHPSFTQTDLKVLAALIRSHSFGLLVSRHEGELFASHLPLLLDEVAGEPVQLVGHFARGNPQWHDLANQQVMAVFSGPHAYISPAWYEADNVVPTWNYTAVHVYGICELITEPADVAKILLRTVQTYEAPRAEPWSIDAETPFFEKLQQGVVGFRLRIERIEGKWKLSQNHPRERREKVIAKLAENPSADAQAISRLMREAL